MLKSSFRHENLLILGRVTKAKSLNFLSPFAVLFCLSSNVIRINDFTPQGHTDLESLTSVLSLELPDFYHTTNAKTMLRGIACNM